MATISLVASGLLAGVPINEAQAHGVPICDRYTDGTQAIQLSADINGDGILDRVEVTIQGGMTQSGEIFGQFNFVVNGNQLHINSFDITAYTIVTDVNVPHDANTRRIRGVGTVVGTTDVVNFVVIVNDNGEGINAPADTIKIKITGLDDMTTYQGE